MVRVRDRVRVRVRARIRIRVRGTVRVRARVRVGVRVCTSFEDGDLWKSILGAFGLDALAC